MRTRAMLMQMSTQGGRQLLLRRQGHQTVLRRGLAHGHGVITTDLSAASTAATCANVNAAPHRRQIHRDTAARRRDPASSAAASGRNGGRRGGGSTGGGDGDAYVSPFASFFDNIERDGRTSSGLGPDDANPSISPVNREEAEELPDSGGGRFLECGIAEDVLKFKTVSWGRMFTPPYVKPGEHQITLRCPMRFVPFRSEKEREIFLQLVEGRYNPERDEVRLVANLFASRIENKRHVVSMLDRLVLASRKLAQEAE